MVFNSRQEKLDNIEQQLKEIEIRRVENIEKCSK